MGRYELFRALQTMNATQNPDNYKFTGKKFDFPYANRLKKLLDIITSKEAN